MADPEKSFIDQIEDEVEPTKPKRKFFRKRFWMVVIMVIVLGLAVNLLLPQIKSLENSWNVVKNLTWWALGLALIVQFLSYICAGFMIHAVLDANHQTLSVWKGAMIYMASYSVGLVAGGWVAGAAATVGWVKSESRDGQTALLAGALPTLFINAGLIGLAVLGVIYLLLIHDLTNGQLIQYIIYLLILSVITFGELAALRYPRVAAKVWIWAASRWAKLLHKSFDPQDINNKMDRFVLVWHSLRGHRWLKPFLGALGFLACDMLTLFFLFVAAGYTLSPGFLLAGYSLPILLGKVIFLFPGGVGLVEVTMVALFGNLTKASQISLIGTLAYRLMSFWIPTIIGFVFAAILSRKTLRPDKKHQIKEENSPTNPDDLTVDQA
jgi:hypothetical protein